MASFKLLIKLYKIYNINNNMVSSFWKVKEERGRRLTPPFPPEKYFFNSFQSTRTMGWFLLSKTNFLLFLRTQLHALYHCTVFLFGFKVNQSLVIRLCHKVRLHALMGIERTTFYFWDKDAIPLIYSSPKFRSLIIWICLQC